MKQSYAAICLISTWKVLRHGLDFRVTASLKSQWKKLAGYDEANNKVPRVLIQEGYLCPCPAAMSAHLFFPVIPKLDSLGQEGSKVA